MTINELRQAKNQRPFEPFRIRLTDGHELPIMHPDAVAWEDDSSSVALVASEGQNYWLAVDLITALVRGVSAGQSGRKKKRRT